MKQQTLAQARSVITDFPLFVSFMMPIHSVPLNSTDELVLDVDTLGGLWTGSIEYWDDPGNICS